MNPTELWHCNGLVPVQVNPCLSPKESWDKLQQIPMTLNRTKRYGWWMDGWNYGSDVTPYVWKKMIKMYQLTEKFWKKIMNHADIARYITAKFGGSNWKIRYHTKCVLCPKFKNVTVRVPPFWSDNNNNHNDNKNYNIQNTKGSLQSQCLGPKKWILSQE